MGSILEKKIRDEKWQRGVRRTSPPPPGSMVQGYGCQKDCTLKGDIRNMELDKTFKEEFTI